VSVHATSDFQADAFARAFAQQVEHTVPLSNRPHMRRVWTPVKDALGAAIVRGEDAATALGRAAQAVRP
jgi:maltose-binding protein MalE